MVSSKAVSLYLTPLTMNASSITSFVEELNWQTFIPINPRNKQPDKTFGPNHRPLGDTGTEMPCLAA
jgi:hypothetical protein